MKKTVLITGCAKGIGKEIALEFARDGYNVIGTYNTSANEIELLKKRIEAIGVSFDCYQLDLTDEVELNKFCNTIKTKYARLDVLINNAAIDLANDFISKTKEEFIKVLDVNLVSPFLLIQKLYSIMSDGVIINISSTDGINTYSTLNMDYSASKAGLINLTKSLALELKDIRIYSVCPNWVDTESIREMNQDYLREEMNRIGQKKLIDPKTIARKSIDLVDGKINSGSIIVIGDSDE